MKKFIAAGALALVATVMTPLAAQAHHDGAGAYCEDPTAEHSTVTGPGPAARKDRNDNGFVCLETNPRNGHNRFVDDILPPA